MKRSSGRELPRAILLLGPTGSGKTPLGELLEEKGLDGRRCFHFDFGSRLRRYAAAPSGALTNAELDVVQTSLRTSALLTDEQFPIAEKLLRGFIAENHIEADSLIVMNGLPRHAGQAAALTPIVDIIGVVVLDCSGPVVHERIRTDAGGDRGGRADDDAEAVARRITIFNEKTLPLIEFYVNRGVRIIRIPVTSDDGAADSRAQLIAQFQRIVHPPFDRGLRGPSTRSSMD